MKTVSLNISERLAAVKIINEFKGSLATLAVLLEDVKKLVVPEEEWTTVDLVKTPSEDGKTTTWNWNDTKVAPKEVELQTETVDYMKDAIKTKNDNKEFTLADTAVVALDAKLK